MTSLEFVRKLAAKGANLNARMTRPGLPGGHTGRTLVNMIGATPFFMAARGAGQSLIQIFPCGVGQFSETLLRGGIDDVDGLAGRHDQQPLDRVPQLADVALPVVALEALGGRRRQRLRRHAVRRGIAAFR